MQKQQVTLTPELFEQFKQDVSKLREVAFACKYLDKNHVFKHFKTVSYPIEYIVSESQINEAKALFLEQKMAFMEANKNNLVALCMGIINEENCGDLLSPRIRMYFKNAVGNRYIVELELSATTLLYYVVHSDNYDMSESPKYMNTGKYRNHGLKEQAQFKNLNRESLLSLINAKFHCAFKELVIDDHYIECDDKYFPESPKK